MRNPAYKSPEHGSGTAVAASDQYSLAVMAYELLTGPTPFRGNPLQMMHKHLSESPPPARSFAPSLHEGVDKVLLCSLQKKPSNRYPSVSAFADNLLNALKGLEYTTTTENNDVVTGDTVANTQKQASAADTVGSTFLNKQDPELEISTAKGSYGGAAQIRAPNEEDTKSVEGEAASGILQPISASSIRSRPSQTRILFSVLAAVIVLSLIISSLALVLSARNGAGNLARTNTQSTLANNNASASAHTTVQPTASITSQAIAQKNQQTPSSGSDINSGVASSTPVASYPTPQPTPTPMLQPTPSPTPTPTPTAVPPPSSSTPKILGGVTNLDGYCQSIGDSSASLDGTTGYSWTCVTSSGQHTGLSFTAACQWQYHDHQAVDRLIDYNNPNSWQCFTGAY